jgi:hypothetical protein
MVFGIDNVLSLMGLLNDDGFVEALTDVEEVIDDVDATLDRVEDVESEAVQAVNEANEALVAVDNRLQRVDETILLLEAKIEAAFSVGFFFFALNRWNEGEVFVAAGLFVMGLLGASSLVVTIVTMPQVRRLRRIIKDVWANSRARSTHPSQHGTEPASTDERDES